MSVIDTLVMEETLTVFNFPGIDKIIPRVEKVLDFCDMLVGHMYNYELGETYLIEVSVLDITDMRDTVRTLCQDINKLSKKPYHLLVYLREIQFNLGVLASNPKYFE